MIIIIEFHSEDQASAFRSFFLSQQCEEDFSSSQRSDVMIKNMRPICGDLAANLAISYHPKFRNLISELCRHSCDGQGGKSCSS
jgi:hypothetical protein